MLKKSNLDVTKTRKLFLRYKLTAEFLSPTQTGLTKSYMDAIIDFSNFLKKHKIHDFDKQQQGQAHKVTINPSSKYYYNNSLIYKEVAFFRPMSKKGDKRIRIEKLDHHCKPHDLLAFVLIGNQIEIINCSSIKNLANFLYQITVSNNIAIYSSQKKPTPPKGKKKPKKINSSSTSYSRDPAVEAFVLNASLGKCESCNMNAPFIRSSNNSYYLEIHHIKRLADGGSDTVSNAVAVCPNCHREFHYGVNMHKLNNQIYRKVKRLIKE